MNLLFPGGQSTYLIKALSFMMQLVKLIVWLYKESLKIFYEIG